MDRAGYENLLTLTNKKLTEVTDCAVIDGQSNFTDA